MKQRQLNDNPRCSASLFSKLFFIWLYPLFTQGWRKDLEYEDLYQVLPEDSSKQLGDKLTLEWEREVEKCKHPEKTDDSDKGESNSNKSSCRRPSLLMALIRMFGKKWALIGIFLFVEECLAKIAQPLLLGLLLRYFNGEFDIKCGYLFATGLVIAVMYYTTSHHPSFFSIVHLNMKVRIACSALLYGKTLKLSQTALAESSVGQIVNLLSNDVARFDFCLNFMHYLWIGPVQLLISVWILWDYYGPTCLSGVVFLILFTPFQSLMGHFFSKLRLKVAGKTDKRVRIMNEIINGIKVIKMYAWEKPFTKMVAETRENEISTIGHQMTLRALNLGLYYVSSKIIIFLTLVTYVLSGNYLTAEKVFVAMALYQNVRLLMTIFFPWGISFLAESRVSIRRIENFLLMEDYNAPTKSLPGKPNLVLSNVCAKWNPKSFDLTISNVDFKAEESKLIAIVGTVGSGKSSLLQAVLQELKLCSGDIKINGTIAYASQDAYILNGSIRENILFGRDYDADWYYKVVDACALRSDFDSMSYGDKTIVGDTAALSGGQKARINLARAVYAKADICLLDDPLSAVDTEVARHIFDKCIRGILRQQICILVTHQLQFLPMADEILVLNNGNVISQGSYADLKKCNINLEQVLSSDENRKSRESLNQNDTEELRRCSVGKRKESIDFNKKEKDRKVSILSFDQQAIEKEAEEVTYSGSIGISTYWKYIRIGSNLWLLGFIFFSNIFTQVLYNGSDFFLQHWIETEKSETAMKGDTQNISDIFMNATSLGNNSTDSTDNNTFIEDEDASTIIRMEDEIKLWWNDRSAQMTIYAILISTLFIMTMVRTIGFFKICMKSSIALHQQLFNGVLRAPMLFFEQNPVGRILNRLTKDIGTIDELLCFTLFDTLEVGLQVVGVIAVVSIINPIFLIPSLIIAIMFYFIRNFFQKTARNLKRLEGTARSPVFSHLSTTLNGLGVIRAFNVQEDFKSKFESHLDLHTTVFYLFNASARWLGIVVDWISIAYITCVTYGVVALGLDGTSAGLAIVNAISLISWFQWGVRQSAEAENQMVSVERVLEYAELESEASLESNPGKKPPSHWPSKGEIEFKNMYVKYGRDETPFLKDITCAIRPLEKVGIVGRTGSGKTSLVSSLFRLSEPSEGTIIIDGVDVLQIGLHDLRSKISIIPQDPHLFRGTLRKNFDPLEEYLDSDIWGVLEDVHLMDMVKDMPSSLQAEISEGGSNLSVGQRQLICLGRAILKQSKILIMDEATASVDHETDSLIQQTIRTKFVNCTVLTVAHRLHTVIDSDRIMVLEAGVLKEFDEPYKLLQNTSSGLHNLVKETGVETAKELLNFSKQKFDSKTKSRGPD